MSRYFFDLSDESSPVFDEEGMLFDELAEARDHAVWCAREIIANDVLEGRPIRLGNYISLQDEARGELARVYFRDVISLIRE